VTNMRILKTAIVATVTCLSLIAQATPDILKEFKGLYNVKTADCIMCHLSPPKEPRNPFGKAIEAGLNNTNDGLLTKAVMQEIEKQDSDGDGVSNIDEINSGSMPGDATSKPVPKTEVKPEEKSALSVLDGVAPKHSFHPALVHFPIALLAVAALLEVLGKHKPESPLHAASVINLALGLISALAALVTGVVAWLRLGYKIEGDLLIHLILASLSIVVGFAAYARREKPSYLILILVCGILVMVAGHFGGNMVYG